MESRHNLEPAKEEIVDATVNSSTESEAESNTNVNVEELNLVPDVTDHTSEENIVHAIPATSETVGSTPDVLETDMTVKNEPLAVVEVAIDTIIPTPAEPNLSHLLSDDSLTANLSEEQRKALQDFHDYHEKVMPVLQEENPEEEKLQSLIAETQALKSANEYKDNAKHLEKLAGFEKRLLDLLNKLRMKNDQPTPAEKTPCIETPVGISSALDFLQKEAAIEQKLDAAFAIANKSDVATLTLEKPEPVKEEPKTPPLPVEPAPSAKTVTFQEAASTSKKNESEPPTVTSEQAQIEKSIAAFKLKHDIKKHKIATILSLGIYGCYARDKMREEKKQLKTLQAELQVQYKR